MSPSSTGRSVVALEVPLSLQPMEAIPVDDLPTGTGWLFEPKYRRVSTAVPIRAYLARSA